MAVLTFQNVGETTAEWVITGLSGNFVSSAFISAGVTEQSFDNGYTGVVTALARTYAGASGTTSASGSMTGLAPGTSYNLQGFTQGVYNSAYYTVDGFKLLSTRPSAFSWTYAKTQSGNFNLTAAEWNSFCAVVNAMRSYKGLAQASFAAASAGGVFTAAMYNAARAALSPMTASLPAEAVPNATIFASQMNGLVSALNGVA